MQKNSDWKLDSLLCFNSQGNRFITVIAYQESKTVNNSLDILLGEKINKHWYFFTASTTIYLFSEYYGQKPKTALSFKKMHDVALKEVYGGYLNKDGTINEHWFISHFEGNGWGDFYHQDSLSDWFLKGRRFKTEKEYYESAHLDKVRNNWYGVKKDSIKQLQKKDEALP